MKILKNMPKILFILFIAELLFACNSFNSSVANMPDSGVTYIASRGNPRVNRIEWSPQEEKSILVTAIGPGNAHQVYIIDITTKKKTILIDTDYSGVIGNGWSPDGKQVTLSVNGAEKRFSKSGLWVMNMEDDSLELIFDKLSDIAWPPQGNTLAFLALDHNPRRLSIYLMDIQTKESKLVYSNPKAIAFSGFSASPGGNSLVFSLDYGAGAAITDIYILDVQTGIVDQLTDDGSSSGSDWSPVGDVIVYVKSKQVGDKTIHSLHLVRPDGSCDVEVPNVDHAFSPTWSPDGRKIAFIGEDGIYILDTDIVFGKDIYQELCP
jgi:Tol biopolymer transport system component